MSFGKKEEQIFLGREIAQHRDYSESTAIEIDQQVRKLVDGGYQDAKRSLVSTPKPWIASRRRCSNGKYLMEPR